MAIYKFERYLRQSSDNHFDKPVPPGTETPRSGIYRCEGCGYEITSVHPQPLPAANHHAHTPQQKLVRWKLIVADSGPG